MDSSLTACSFCGYEQSHVEQPTYSQVFEEPFFRLEGSSSIVRLDHLAVILDQIECELTVFLAEEKHAEQTGQKRR